MIYPLPAALISCGKDEEEYNMLTVAWVGTICTNPAMCYISVRPERHSYSIIEKNKAFVINLTTTGMVKNADRCGTYSGKNVDKFKKDSIETVEAEHVSAPILKDSPVALECKVTDIVPLGSHDMFIADVVAVNVDESLIGEGGRLHISRAKLSAFAHGEYFELGRRIGKFGFSVKKAKKERK